MITAAQYYATVGGLQFGMAFVLYNLPGTIREVRLFLATGFALGGLFSLYSLF